MNWRSAEVIRRGGALRLTDEAGRERVLRRVELDDQLGECGPTTPR